MIRVLLLFTLQAAAPDTLPPPGVITGVVTDLSHRPIQRALVEAMPGALQSRTDAEGRFQFQNRAPGLHVLSVRALGYQQRLLHVTLEPASGWRGAVALNLTVQQLPDLEARVNAWKPAEYAGTSRYDGFFMRQRQGFGTYFSRDEIDRIGAFHFTQLLQQVPGFRVSWNPPGAAQPTTLRITRCAESNPPSMALYVDGIRRRASASDMTQGYGIRVGSVASDSNVRRRELEFFGDMLDSINPRDIEMMEVYRGVAQIPAAFDRDVCAVVAIWTRWNEG
jgi:hypothetical protein